MADLTYTMDINGAPALAALNKVETNLAKLKTSFGGLQGLLAGLFTTAVIGNALKFADNINDIAIATGVATQSVLGFNNALLTNGGNSESAAKMLVKLSLSVEEANSGALKMSDAFSDVGISLNDLKSLSDTDVLSRTILGLSKIPEASKRAALATQLLGKGAKGIDFVGVGGDIGKATQEAAKYTASIDKAAAVQDKITQAVNNFQLALLTALDPLLTFVAGLKPEQIEKFVEAVVKIGGAVASIAILTRVITGLGAAIIGIGAYWVAATGKITSGVVAIAGGFASLGTTIARTFTVLKTYALPAWLASGSLSGLFTAIGDTLAMLAKRFGHLITGIGITALGIGGFATGIAQAALVIAGIATTAYVAAEAIDAIFDTKIVKTFSDGLDYVWSKLKGFGASITDIWTKIKGMMGIKSDPTVAPGAPSAPPDEWSKQAAAASEAATKAAAAAAKVNREQLNARAKAFAEFKLQQSEVLKSYTETNALMLQKLKLELELVGKTAEEVEKAHAIADLRAREKSIVADLVKEQEKLKLAMSVPGTHANEINDLRKRYNAVGATIKGIETNTVGVIDATSKYIDKIQTAKLLEQDRLNILDRITQQMEKQQRINDAMLQVRQTAEGQLAQVKFEGAQMNRAPEEKRQAQIQEDLRKAALEAGRAFASTFDDTNMSAQDAKRLAEGLDLIAEKYKEIADAQRENLKVSQTWMTGWTDAFNQYLDSATNAANQARDIFNSVTSSMNSAIDKFVDSGKFSFRDLSESIIKDILKIELKAAAAKVFGAMGGLGGAATAAAGGGGFFSSIASMLGFASGGNPPVGKPSIVGEKGPELFIPKTAGTIVPNTGFNSNGQSQQPQNVTYVTNNISALDARSVAQLFAANRKTLLGSVQLAQKELPYGNR